MAFIILLSIIILVNNMVENNTKELDTQHLEFTDIPDYDFDLLYGNKIRKSSLSKKSNNHITDGRIQEGERDFLDNNISVEGVTHFDIEKHSNRKKVNLIEKEFRQLMAMKGITYIYKRDIHWRTWRVVQYPSGNKTVFYKCENAVKINCTRCHNGGIWAMESEPPPCPFELFSVINKGQLCAVIYTHLDDVMKSCPTVITFEDLTGTCHNPIETKWRIKRLYDSPVSERFPTAICGGRDYCEISTSYTITPDSVAFRIINSTNNIIFSRIMKAGLKNYACYEDCGYNNANRKQ